MDARKFQAIIDAINLLKILSIGEKDIKSNSVYTHKQVQKKVKAILD